MTEIQKQPLLPTNSTLRNCLREPIPEIYDAARYLDAAVSAHLSGRTDLTAELIRLADMPIIRDWTESLWGANSPYVKLRQVPDAPPYLERDDKIKQRMPTGAERALLIQRDGYNCRFCGIPVVRKEIRERIRELYPEALPWGPRNIDQHAGLQAMWVQYDHLVPHARGGNNDLGNMVITCAPCNYGRWKYTVEEVGLLNPLTREPLGSWWDGLERFR